MGVVEVVVVVVVVVADLYCVNLEQWEETSRRAHEKTNPLS